MSSVIKIELDLSSNALHYSEKISTVLFPTLLSCYKLNRCYIKLSLVNILENVFVFIEISFKMLLFKGSVLIYAEHCIYIYIYIIFIFFLNQLKTVLSESL